MASNTNDEQQQNRYLDPQLWYTEGVALLDQSGAQFTENSSLGEQQNQWPSTTEYPSMDLKVDFDTALMSKTALWHITGDRDAVLASVSPHTVPMQATPRPYSHAHYDPTTPNRIRLQQQHMLLTPPNSADSPHSQLYQAPATPTIAYPVSHQPPNLSLDTAQVQHSLYHPSSQGRATLSPNNAYLTPMSQRSSQMPLCQQNNMASPTPPTRGRANSTIGHGMANHMQHVLLQQAEYPPSIQDWAQDNVNFTSQLRSLRREQPPLRSQQHPRSAPPSMAGQMYSCEHVGCNKEFRTKASLKHHERYHEEPTFYCSNCDVSFHFDKDLKRHCTSKLHLGTSAGGEHKCQVYECADKPEGWARRDHWKRHMEKVHSWTFPASSGGSSGAGQ